MAKGDDDLLKEAKEAFDICVDTEAHNRTEALDDLKFARLGDQWPIQVRNARERANRPCLTINRLPAFIRQVVNDTRQNKPSIKVHPVDSGADVHTAKVYDGLIRNIEQSSNADVAYDTGSEFAVTCGFGYWRLNVDYATYDAFDQDIRIERVANPFSVYGDPYSTAADSSDWEVAFVTDRLPKEEFQERYGKDRKAESWDDTGYGTLGAPWVEGDNVLVAEWWTREEEALTLLKLSNGEIVDKAEYEQAKASVFDLLGITVVADRPSKGWKVVQRIMSGAEILETNPWAGRWIPIVPVYGDEVNVEGKRYFRSLIRDAKDPQRMHNYWRTTATEQVALQPKVPFIGPEEAFQGEDAAKWDTANVESYSYISYKGATPPQRQMPPQAAAGAIQEALTASDDMKAVMGLYDASLGQRSNETSGKAIMARQREGDVSTFHFTDNLSRAIRHTGRILLDLIPRVYTGDRIVRVLGEDGTVASVKLGQAGGAASAPQAPPPPAPGPMSAPGASPGVPGQTQGGLPVGVERIYDLSSGKYDLTVQSGPNYTTRRQEAADQMMTLLQSFPAAAPVIGDLIAKNLDWPGADEIAERLKALAPQPPDPNAPPPPDPHMAEVQAKAKAAQMQVQNEAARRNQELAQEYDIAQKKIAADQQSRLAAAHADAAAKLELAKIDMATKLEVAKINAGFDAATDIQSLVAQAVQAALETQSAPLHPAVRDQMGQMTQAFSDMAQQHAAAAHQMTQAMTAPKEVVRDANGRAIGTRTVMPQPGAVQ